MSGLGRMRKMANTSELTQIVDCIKNDKNFLLSGGAGSGKTYTLIEVLKSTFENFPNANIACITYTNAAVAEIISRFDNRNLRVSTIHDFLWDNIKNFQNELKLCLCELSKKEDFTKFRIDGKSVEVEYFVENQIKIDYKDYLKIKSGVISHDELIIIADLMYKNYPKLCDILKDKFKCIFVDEYQDTDPKVVDILLRHIASSKKKNVIGFFGDSMQSIYDDGIGDLTDFIGKEVCEIKKTQNRRNPKTIIELANRLRLDGLEQIPSEDLNAPNMDRATRVIKNGKIRFLYSNSTNVECAKKYLDWNFEDSKNTKELNLTHNLIADKAGFRNLMDIYDKDLILAYRDRIRSFIKDEGILTDFTNMTFHEVIARLLDGKTDKEKEKVLPTKSMQSFINENPDLYLAAKNYPYLEFQRLYVIKDQLIDDKNDKESGGKRDDLIRHLLKIESNITFYREGKISEFIKKTDFKIASLANKRELKKIIDLLSIESYKNIEQVIEEADEFGICKIDDNLLRFIDESKYIYDRVKRIDYNEIRLLYRYINGFTPFSTQHKTKGREFDNVLVVLDN
ncbi:MAG: ATP-dependent helicase [Bacteroidetes bacterium]|nr:ATP-dependent helicase [Bacteroidota bacterium]